MERSWRICCRNPQSENEPGPRKKSRIDVSPEERRESHAIVVDQGALAIGVSFRDHNFKSDWTNRRGRGSRAMVFPGTFRQLLSEASHHDAGDGEAVVGPKSRRDRRAWFSPDQAPVQGTRPPTVILPHKGGRRSEVRMPTIRSVGETKSTNSR